MLDIYMDNCEWRVEKRDRLLASMKPSNIKEEKGNAH